jgi:glycosyltransferase involved in cell wall biosynthesis
MDGTFKWAAELDVAVVECADVSGVVGKRRLDMSRLKTFTNANSSLGKWLDQMFSLSQSPSESQLLRSRFLLIGSLDEYILRFRRELILSLQTAGYEVHVACPGLTEGSAVHTELSALGFIPHDIPLSRTGMNPLSDLWLVFALYRLMRNLRPARVLGYAIKPVIYGSIAAWFARVPHRYALVPGLGYAFNESNAGSTTQRLIHALYRVGLKCTCGVIFQNPDDLALFRLLGILGLRQKSFLVNGSGVNLPRYALAPLPPPTAPVRFLLIARLLKSKGIREYAYAASIVKQRMPAAQFDIVGWFDKGPDALSQQELTQWVKDGTVNFLGKLVDVRPAISACLVYVLPSYREGTPRSVLEAMSMGRAIISTDTPGCRQTVREGINGYLVPVGDGKTLAEAMLRFITNPELAAQMAAESRKMAEEIFDVNKVTHAMLTAMGISNDLNA